MSGKHYYDLLGLPENSSMASVKKKFRSLAKEFHPDLNPDEEATVIFQQLLDAYERILKQDFGARPKPPQQPQRTREEVHRERWEQMNRKWKEEEEELNHYYHGLVTGWKYRLKILYAILALWIMSAMIADEYLPLKKTKDVVIAYDFTRYQSSDNDYVQEVTLRDHGTVYLANYHPKRFYDFPEVTLHQTAICRSNRSLTHRADKETYTPEIHFSICRLKIPIFLFLSLSLMIPFFRKPSAFMVLGSWINFYLSGTLIAYIVLFYFRFISLFTFGYFP